MALAMFSVAIFFSYALQFYVVMDIIGPNILKPHMSDRMFPYAEQFTRVLLNVLTREYLDRSWNEISRNQNILPKPLLDGRPVSIRDHSFYIL